MRYIKATICVWDFVKIPQALIAVLALPVLYSVVMDEFVKVIYFDSLLLLLNFETLTQKPCLDIDECETHNICNQRNEVCTNLRGSYR